MQHKTKPEFKRSVAELKNALKASRLFFASFLLGIKEMKEQIKEQDVEKKEIEDEEKMLERSKARSAQLDADIDTLKGQIAAKKVGPPTPSNLAISGGVGVVRRHGAMGDKAWEQWLMIGSIFLVCLAGCAGCAVYAYESMDTVYDKKRDIETQGLLEDDCEADEMTAEGVVEGIADSEQKFVDTTDEVLADTE